MRNIIYLISLVPILATNPLLAQTGPEGNNSLSVPRPVFTPQPSKGTALTDPRRAAPTKNPTPAPPSPPKADDSKMDNYRTCFAYTRFSGGPVSVQCSWRRDWCEGHVRNKTVDGSTSVPTMTVVLGCSREPLYCFGYNNGNSGGCYPTGNECVSNRNNFASQQGASVGACNTYVGGVVRN